MLYRKKQKLILLLNTVGEMILTIDAHRNVKAALSDCVEAITAIEAALWQELPSPSDSLDMLSNLRDDFVSLLDTEINCTHVSSLTHYLGMVRNRIKGELVPNCRAVFMPHNAGRWHEMAPLYDAVISVRGNSALVVPIPYLKPCEDDVRLFCEYARFPGDLPLTHYRDVEISEESPDLLVFGDLYSTDIRIHRPYTADELRRYACLTISLPSMQGLPAALRERAANGGGEELLCVIRAALEV